MRARFKSLINDNRGVSPVIGVILMVAITVILAAVIGTFVLGLGDSLQQAPQAQLDSEAGGSTSDLDLTLSHNGGDSLTTSDVRVVIEGGASIDDLSTISDGDQLSVGGSVEFTHAEITNSDSNVPAGESRVRVIHKPSESVILDTTVDFPETTP